MKKLQLESWRCSNGNIKSVSQQKLSSRMQINIEASKMRLAKQVLINLGTMMNSESFNSMNSWKVIIVKSKIQMMSTVKSDRKIQKSHLLNQLHRSDKAQASGLKFRTKKIIMNKCMEVLTEMEK